MTQKIHKAKLMKIMLKKEGMDFNTEEGWNAIVDHIDVHHTFLAEKLSGNVTWNEAMRSWYENIYLALKLGIEISSLSMMFRNTSSGELYLAVSDHWYMLKQNNPGINAVEAVKDYAVQNSPKKRGVLSNIIANSEKMYSKPRNTFVDVFITAVYGNLAGKDKNKKPAPRRRRAA